MQMLGEGSTILFMSANCSIDVGTVIWKIIAGEKVPRVGHKIMYDRSLATGRQKFSFFQNANKMCTDFITCFYYVWKR